MQSLEDINRNAVPAAILYCAQDAFIRDGDTPKAEADYMRSSKFANRLVVEIRAMDDGALSAPTVDAILLETFVPGSPLAGTLEDRDEQTYFRFRIAVDKYMHLSQS